MLVEFKKVRQEAGEGYRRWYEDQGFDLVVWHRSDSSVAGFQLLYDEGNGERALTWRPDQGFMHSRVDAGSLSPFKNMTPVLLPDGEVPWETLREAFAARAAELEPALRELVQARLEARA